MKHRLEPIRLNFIIFFQHERCIRLIKRKLYTFGPNKKNAGGSIHLGA